MRAACPAHLLIIGIISLIILSETLKCEIFVRQISPTPNFPLSEFQTFSPAFCFQPCQI